MRRRPAPLAYIDTVAGVSAAESDPGPLSQFVLHTPSDKAAKNWISQGYTAERGVVIADLVIGGESHGPHASLLSLRRRVSQRPEC